MLALKFIFIASGYCGICDGNRGFMGGGIGAGWLEMEPGRSLRPRDPKFSGIKLTSSGTLRSESEAGPHMLDSYKD